MRLTELDPRVLVALSTAFVMCATATADALVFDLVDTKLTGGKRVLWVRDCGVLEDGPCREATSGFTAGDSDRLRRVLRDGDEVWMYSGGGNLEEGVLIGRLLRERQATVRVPMGAYCVSACTVAFLGGVFRFVDGSYKVHAASLFLQQRLDGDWLQEITGNPSDVLLRWAENLQNGFWEGRQFLDGARTWAARLFDHFQRALFPLGEFPPASEPARAEALARWKQAVPRVNYRSTPQFVADSEKVRREGVPAAQDILMRMERDSMTDALTSLRSVEDQLGPRAKPALDMLELMYSSRITLTATVSQETLLRMGFTTRLFNPGR